MHDIRAIRDTPEAFVAGWTSRGVEDAQVTVDRILELDRELRAAQTAGQDALSKRNAASKAIGAAMGRKDMAEAERLKAEVEGLKGEIAANEAVEADKGRELRDILAGLKNLAAADVPDGEDEAGNVETGRWGEPRRTGPAKDHADLGEAIGLLDFEAAAKMSGARFAVLKGGLARLERALGQFMLDMQTGQHGYLEVNPPYLVRDEAMFGTGQLPKFKDDLFAAESIAEDELALYLRVYEEREIRVLVSQIEDLGLRQLVSASPDESAEDFLNRRLTEIASNTTERRTDALDQGAYVDRRFLIPTAEVSLTNLVRETILSEDELATPMRLTALTPCFRAEAGSAGRDTRGLIRQHQFSKVELVSITRPEDSGAEHERMTGCAEAVLKALELPYRRMLLCKGDMGFSARKTFDLEVWLPSQDTYREISSCSNCGDFQARRMDARFKRAGEKKTEFVHTLNGSGLAVGRTLVAVMENYQDEGGRIAVPEVLKRYMPEGVTHVG
ncbi:MULTISPECIES: serine--tRNA ligase [unclassified Brevundimonas]|jgi:seryl-tRNA synthetase|uniref:serine--tRNA ligase n=1 Tax=unclassified Brevundimonas TaxID=2622653 RepID=UPI000C50AC89|nr:MULTISPECIES: serine--tRNA ligase [unclassified Brevundimonas]MAL87290.1 serine--tRNA ligase [Brevundimonas sp.]|tara:strand:+ start:550 stop:2055 length:1506 start_codon:yes stop_codon:yes gene_type:complete